MSEYRINQSQRAGEGYGTMIISDKVTGEQIAEYRLTPGCERAEIAATRRSINRHLDNGGTLGNYQW